MLINLELLKSLQMNAPRYTSYPTADQFRLDFTVDDQLIQIKNNCSIDEPMSLYIHIPFCNTLCLYCGCNKIITNNRNVIDRYLDYLALEIEL